MSPSASRPAAPFLCQRGPPRIARGGFSDRLATRRWGQIVRRLRQLTVGTPVTGANPAQMLFELLNARTKLLLIDSLAMLSLSANARSKDRSTLLSQTANALYAFANENFASLSFL